MIAFKGIKNSKYFECLLLMSAIASLGVHTEYNSRCTYLLSLEKSTQIRMSSEFFFGGHDYGCTPFRGLSYRFNDSLRLKRAQLLLYLAAVCVRYHTWCAHAKWFDIVFQVDTERFSSHHSHLSIEYRRKFADKVLSCQLFYCSCITNLCWIVFW